MKKDTIDRLEERLLQSLRTQGEGETLAPSVRIHIMEAIRRVPEERDERVVSNVLRWSCALSVASFALAAYVVPSSWNESTEHLVDLVDVSPSVMEEL